jgi:hypothetical protein
MPHTAVIIAFVHPGIPPSLHSTSTQSHTAKPPAHRRLKTLYLSLPLEHAEKPSWPLRADNQRKSAQKPYEYSHIKTHHIVKIHKILTFA